MKDVVEEENDEDLNEVAKESALIIACWGNHGKYNDRATEMISNLQQTIVSSSSSFDIGSNKSLHCPHQNKVSGQPTHPLYLNKNLIPIPYQTK